MKATLTLNNARITNVEEVMVIKGQVFSLRLDLEGQSYTGLDWYTNNDRILTIGLSAENLKATIQADEVGTSNVVITAGDFKVAKTLKITVVDEIPEEADTLDATAGEAVPK